MNCESVFPYSRMRISFLLSNMILKYLSIKIKSTHYSLSCSSLLKMILLKWAGAYWKRKAKRKTKRSTVKKIKQTPWNFYWYINRNDNNDNNYIMHNNNNNNNINGIAKNNGNNKKYKKSQNFKNIKTKINYMKSKKKNILTTAKTTTIIKN